jgi:RNA polymerase sigma factor (sigma-70 family)
VAVLLYVNGLTQREVGERFGVSESRISQIHTALRKRLYEQLADERSLFSEIG